jgi:hypothetical protein
VLALSIRQGTQAGLKPLQPLPKSPMRRIERLLGIARSDPMNLSRPLFVYVLTGIFTPFFGLIGTVMGVPVRGVR